MRDEEVERLESDLLDAYRMIGFLIKKSGGSVTIGLREFTAMDAKPMILRQEDPINSTVTYSLDTPENQAT